MIGARRRTSPRFREQSRRAAREADALQPGLARLPRRRRGRASRRRRPGTMDGDAHDACRAAGGLPPRTCARGWSGAGDPVGRIRAGQVRPLPGLAPNGPRRARDRPLAALEFAKVVILDDAGAPAAQAPKPLAPHPYATELPAGIYTIRAEIEPDNDDYDQRTRARATAPSAAGKADAEGGGPVTRLDFRTVFKSHELQRLDVPVEIYASDMKIVGRTTSSQDVKVEPGRRISRSRSFPRAGS